MSNCAILIFAKNTFSESNSKRIVYSEKENCNLWTILNHKTIQIAQKSKIPYFIADENSQVGTTFGEKISTSIQSIFEQGFEKIIVIGNDCPELTATHLQIAKAKLENNDFVFGPDFKGGAYLLGISKNQYKFQEFQNFNWQNSQLFNNITSFYSQAQLEILPFLNDVNDAFSFKKAVHNLTFESKLKNTLLAFFTFLNQSFDFLLSKIVLFKILFLNYRGPPQMLIFPVNLTNNFYIILNNTNEKTFYLGDITVSCRS